MNHATRATLLSEFAHKNWSLPLIFSVSSTLNECMGWSQWIGTLLTTASSITTIISRTVGRIWANENPSYRWQTHASTESPYCTVFSLAIFFGLTLSLIRTFSKTTRNKQLWWTLACNHKRPLWPEFETMDLDDMKFLQGGATWHMADATITLLHQKFFGCVISSFGVTWSLRSMQESVTPFKS